MPNRLHLASSIVLYLQSVYHLRPEDTIFSFLFIVPCLLSLFAPFWM